MDSFSFLLPKSKRPPQMYLELQGIKKVGLTRIPTYDHLITTLPRELKPKFVADI
jgi:hypothetical protein